MNLQPPDFSGSGFTDITPLSSAANQPAGSQTSSAPLLSLEEALRSEPAQDPSQAPQPVMPVTLQTGQATSPQAPTAGSIAPLMPWIIANVVLVLVVVGAILAFRLLLSPTRQMLFLQTVAYRLFGRRQRVLNSLSTASGLDPAIVLSSPGAMKHAISKAGPLLDAAATNELAVRAFGQTLIETKPHAPAAAAPTSKKPAKPGAPSAPGMTIRKPMTPRKLGIAGGVTPSSAPTSRGSTTTSSPQTQSRGGIDGRASGSSPRK